MLFTGNPCFAELEETLEQLKEVGFGCFELGVFGLSGKEVAKFAQKAIALDMEPQCTELHSVTEADLIGQNLEFRKKAISRIKESILKTRDMGATILSGPFFQGLCATSQVGPTQDEWNWAVEGLRDCAEFAQECGVRLAGEPLNRFEMHIVNTIADAYKMCEAVGLSNMGILADTHHSNIEELHLVDAYVKHIDRIFNIHISENNRGIPGSGHAIPPELFSALLEGGYDGNFVIEAFNANVPETLPLLRIWRPFAETEMEIAEKGLQFMQKHLA